MRPVDHLQFKQSVIVFRISKMPYMRTLIGEPLFKGSQCVLQVNIVNFVMRIFGPMAHLNLFQ